MSDQGSGTYEIVTPPTHGSLSAISGSSVNYTPDNNYTGADSFTFNLAGSAPATIWLTVVDEPSDNRPNREAHTVVPALTASHWQNPDGLQSSAHPTKSDYLTFITSTYNRRRPSNPDHFYDYAPFFYNSFFYKALGDQSYLDTALGNLDSLYEYYTTGASSTDPEYQFRQSDFGHTLGALNWIIDGVTNMGSSTEVKTRILKLEEKTERFNPPTVPWQFGAGNQSFGPAAGRKIIAKIYPTDADTAERETMSGKIWQDWATRADTFENASNYNALFNTFVLNWLTAASDSEKTALYDKPEFKNYVERYLAQVSPLGLIPSYGDAFGFGTVPGSWINIFEHWASIFKTRDLALAGKLRWAAHASYSWVLGQETPMDFWGNLTDTTIGDVMRAWEVVDDSITPVTPTGGSTVLYRHAVTMKSDAERNQTGYPAVVNSSTIPDKLILRSGWGPESLYAMFELAPPMGHSHYDTGSLNSLIAGGSYLLGDTPYAVKDHRFHNSFQVVPNGAETFSNSFSKTATMASTVSLLQEASLGTVAEFSVSNYLGRPLTLTRSAFLVSDPVSQAPYLWVRDRIVGDRAGAFTGSIGPAWQTETIYGTSGEGWANTTFQTIPVAYFGQKEYITQWNNRSYDLAVAFPTGSGSLSVDNVSHDTTRLTSANDEQNNAKFRLWNKANTTVGTAPVSFSTLLIPHAPAPDASSLVSAFTTVVDDPQVTIIKQSKGGIDQYLGVNDSEAAVEFGGFRTDASHFIISQSGNTVNYDLIGATELIKDTTTIVAPGSNRQNREGTATLTPVPTVSGSRSGGSSGSLVIVRATSTATVNTPKVSTTTITTPLSIPLTFNSGKPRLTGPFGYGIRSEQVKVLEGMLAQDPTLYPSGKITGYYGNELVKAVSLFQKRYKIVMSGTLDTTGFGLAGPATRVKLNEVFGSKPVSTTNLETLTVAQKQALTGQVQTQIKELQAKLLQLLIQLHANSSTGR
jgi:peptidoglycan hydrolase-like protein with peptidoglycan-binding domain